MENTDDDPTGHCFRKSPLGLVEHDAPRRRRGAFKNALDWVVGSAELIDKRVGLLSASAASQFAHPQMLEILRTMSAAAVPGRPA